MGHQQAVIGTLPTGGCSVKQFISFRKLTFVNIKWVASQLLFFFTMLGFQNPLCMPTSLPGIGFVFVFLMFKHSLQWVFYSPWCSGLIFFLKLRCPTLPPSGEPKPLGGPDHSWCCRHRDPVTQCLCVAPEFFAKKIQKTLHDTPNENFMLIPSGLLKLSVLPASLQYCQPPNIGDINRQRSTAGGWRFMDGSWQ